MLPTVRGRYKYAVKRLHTCRVSMSGALMSDAAEESGWSVRRTQSTSPSLVSFEVLSRPLPLRKTASPAPIHPCGPAAEAASFQARREAQQCADAATLASEASLLPSAMHARSLLYADMCHRPRLVCSQWAV